MDGGTLAEVFRLVLPPAVGAVVATTVGGILKRSVRRPPQPEPQAAATGTLKLSGVASSTWPAPAPQPDSAARPGRLRRTAGSIWELLDRLPPLERRTSAWKATLLGSTLVGFGIAGYFRTRADALVGLVLTIPVFVAVGLAPELGGESAEVEASAAPAWAVATVYTSMALTGLYSYLRVVSSNRRLDEVGRSPLERWTPDERREALTHEVAKRTGRGWRVESAGEFEAVISRVRRPNHLLHFFLTMLTLYIWGVVWIFLTMTARRRQEREYRRAFVDGFGNRSVEPLPPPEASASGGTT